MRHKTILLSLFFSSVLNAQQSTINEPKPSLEMLEFLAEFNMQTKNDDTDYDLILHHAKQDLKQPPQEQNNEH